jgi:hypothetical protein
MSFTKGKFKARRIREKIKFSKKILFYLSLPARNIIYIRAFLWQMEQENGQIYMVF